MESLKVELVLKGRLSFLIFVALGIIVPSSTLSLAGLLQLGIWPACVEPFGLNRILIGYLISCLPISMVCAAWFRDRYSQFATSIRFAAIICGLLVAFGSAVISLEQVASNLGEQQLGRHLGRILWTFCLQLPWIIAACFAIDESSSVGIRKPDLKGVLTAALVILVVPVCYVEFVIERQLGIFRAEREHLQIAKAWKTVSRLNSLGTKPWTSTNTVVADAGRINERNQLEKIELELEKELGNIYGFLAAETLNGDSTDEQKINYALQLSKLAGENIDRDYLSEAMAILQTDDLCKKHPRAALIMGSIFEHQSKFQEAVEHYERVLDLSASMGDTIEAQQEATVFIGYERLANNLRRSGKGKAAEKLLLDARDKFPERTVVFNYQLGLHYELAGRPLNAIECFQTIPTSAPRFGELAAARLNNIQKRQLGCRIGVTR